MERKIATKTRKIDYKVDKWCMMKMMTLEIDRHANRLCIMQEDGLPFMFLDTTSDDHIASIREMLSTTNVTALIRLAEAVSNEQMFDLAEAVGVEPTSPFQGYN